MENHVCDFNEKWGTGDKEESFIEQGHQIGARESSRYTRLTNFVKKAKSALNSKTKANHPLVAKKKAEVLSITKQSREKKDQEHVSKKMEGKKIKREGYIKNFKKEE